MKVQKAQKVQKLKLYTIQKKLWARSAQHALKLDKVTPVLDVWIESDWFKNNVEEALPKDK